MWVSLRCLPRVNLRDRKGQSQTRQNSAFLQSFVLVKPWKFDANSNDQRALAPSPRRGCRAHTAGQASNTYSIPVILVQCMRRRKNNYTGFSSPLIVRNQLQKQSDFSHRNQSVWHSKHQYPRGSLQYFAGAQLRLQVLCSAS